MATVTIGTAKTTLSQRIARAEAGEEVIIARFNSPVAKLVPISPRAVRRQPGALKGTGSIGPEFFEPLPDDELLSWE